MKLKKFPVLAFPSLSASHLVETYSCFLLFFLRASAKRERKIEVAQEGFNLVARAHMMVGHIRSFPAFYFSFHALFPLLRSKGKWKNSGKIRRESYVTITIMRPAPTGRISLLFSLLRASEGG